MSSVLRVPADLSVVGYDNTAYSRLPRLSITTIDGHSAEVGQLAGRTLVARISGDASSVETRLLSPTLIRRLSTGPPPALVTPAIWHQPQVCIAAPRPSFQYCDRSREPS